MRCGGWAWRFSPASLELISLVVSSRSLVAMAALMLAPREAALQAFRATLLAPIPKGVQPARRALTATVGQYLPLHPSMFPAVSTGTALEATTANLAPAVMTAWLTRTVVAAPCVLRGVAVPHLRP